MAKRIPVECPHCSQTLKLKNPKLVGMKVKCPKCNKPFVVQVDTLEETEYDEDNFLAGVSSYDEDYPLDIWNEANKRRAQLSAAERAAKQAQFKEVTGAGWGIRVAAFGAFLASFAVFDILWVVFAAGSAYGIVVGEFGQQS